MRLTGYRRSDGRVGFRNHVAVIPLVGCMAEVARRICDRVDGARGLIQPLGCELLGPDAELYASILYNCATHPNVGAVIFIGMSCAAPMRFALHKRVSQTGRPTRLLNLHTSTGGTTKLISEGARLAKSMALELAKQERESVELKHIVLGVKCGSSDKTSFETCNPILGRACDHLIDAGATVVLSEDYELHGGAEDLAARAVDKKTARAIRRMAKRLERNLRLRAGMDIVKLSGNTRQAREASRQRYCKAGTRPIQKVVPMHEVVSGPGLVILDAPNSDLTSITCLMAAGCNLLAFTTGRGTPVGTPFCPTIKITANGKTARKMKENIDVHVSGADPDTEARKLIRAILAYANGKLTKAEKLGHCEACVPLAGVTF